MKIDTLEIPFSEETLVIRTDFTDDQKWSLLKTKISATYAYGFKSHAEFIDDINFEGLSNADFEKKIISGYEGTLIFLADSISLSNPENLIMCVDLYEHKGRYFRVIPSQIWSIESNLSISNMDFDEFYESCDSDKIFRGFE